MRTRLPSRRPSARSAQEASCCATVRNTIRWPPYGALPLTRFTTTITDRHLSDAAASQSPGTPARCCGPANARYRRVSAASARSALRRSRRYVDYARPYSPGYPADRAPQCARFAVRAEQGDNAARTPFASPGFVGDKPARRQHGADQRAGNLIVHHPLQELLLRTGAQMLRGQQFAQRGGPCWPGWWCRARRREAPHSVPFPSGQDG